MDDLTTNVGVGGISGIVGVFLSWFGFKSKVEGIEKDFATLKGTVRFTDTCNEISKGLTGQLTDIKVMQKEMRDDIKELIRRE